MLLLTLLACADSDDHGALPGVPDDTTDTGDTSCGVCDTGDSGDDTATIDTDTSEVTPTCGDDACDATEGCTDCPEDCGACPATCGDTTCDEGESCWNCEGDCGACDCPNPVEVIIYDAAAWNVLADAFLADPSPCADYYFSIPSLSDDQTTPRSSGEPENMRARGPRLHAMAEFHWGGWSDASGTWYERGVEFRRRMVDAGYDVDAGDTWAVNELPSTVRSDDDARQNAMDVLEGLYDGPEGATDVKGAVFITGMGQATTNFSVYAPYLEDWLEDASFWESVNLHAEWWAQEVYTDPDYTCVAGASVAERSTATNAYVEHVARYAEVGPSTVNTAQSYLGRAYTPLMNAVWGSASGGYGNTDVPLDTMKHHVSGQVYAARSWSNSHDYPDGRIGFAWDRQDGVTDADLDDLAARLASSIHYAYDEGGGTAAHACSPSGAYTWCQCEVAGAAFNDGWDTFDTW